MNKNPKTTFPIRTMTMRAEAIMNTAPTPQLQETAKKVHEALRYSDPVSDSLVIDMDNKIHRELSDFEDAVNEQDLELAEAIAATLLNTISERNSLCKATK